MVWYNAGTVVMWGMRTRHLREAPRRPGRACARRGLPGPILLALREQMCYNLAMANDGELRVRFGLPLPPGINQQYATVNGRRVLSRDSRNYKKTVRRSIRRLRAEGVISDALVAALREGHIGLFIDFYFETPHRRDLDGGLKVTQDAICEALGVNDNRVVDVHLVKRIDPLRPRIEVELEAIPDWLFDREYVFLGTAGENELKAE
jgi:crossover junction endodeoxyribonuclease RusA